MTRGEAEQTLRTELRRLRTLDAVMAARILAAVEAVAGRPETLALFPPEPTKAPWSGKVLERVRDYMLRKYPQWSSLEDMTRDLGYDAVTTPSISAKLRTLRADGYVVEKVKSRRGVWHYRVQPRV